MLQYLENKDFEENPNMFKSWIEKRETKFGKLNQIAHTY